MPTKPIDQIAREAAEKIGEHPIDMGGLISFDAGDRREAQAVIGGIIAAAIREASAPLVESGTKAADVLMSAEHYLVGRDDCATTAIRNAVRSAERSARAALAAFAEPESTTKPT